MRIRTIVPMLLATLGAGCATEVQPPPVLQEVCRAYDDSLCIGWVYAAQASDLKILGTNLLEAWEVDLGTTDAPSPQGAFRAWIGEQELEQVHLTDQSLRGSQTLECVLPGELATGVYPVTLETPAGQRSQRSNEFEVRNPLWIELEIDKPTLPRGDRAQWTVHVENRAPVELTEVRLDLSQGGTGAFQIPPAPPAFSLEGLASADVNVDLVAASPGQPQLAVRISALADGRIPIGDPVPTILTAGILDEARLAISGAIQPPVGPVGSQIVLSVTARNEGGVAARGAHLLEPTVEGAGQIQWDPDPGVSRDIAPGQQITLRWYGTAQAAGTAFVSTSVVATEALSAQPLRADLPTAIQLVIQ